MLNNLTGGTIENNDTKFSDTLDDIITYEEVMAILESHIEKVVLGKKVTLLQNGEEKIYTIGLENDTRMNLISYNSPIIKAILGQGIGFKTKVHLPSAIYNIEILHIC